MVSRRSFLLTGSAILLGQYLQGCGQREDRLKIDLLKGSLPQQLLQEFIRKSNKQPPILFKSWPNLETIQELLTANAPLDLLTLSHFNLAAIRQQRLIKPLDLDKSEVWPLLPPVWHSLVTEDNRVWGAPYRYGYTAIAYRSDKFHDRGLDFPQDWSDLWRPELKQQFSLLNQPREIIGLVLKTLGHSYNNPDLTTIKSLESELMGLHGQAKFYDSTNYLQSLVLGDTIAAVGWSSDILPLVKRYPFIKMIVPRTGTALWSDLWVRATNSKDSYDSLVTQWLDFCWQGSSAQKISLLTSGISPVLGETNMENAPNNVNDQSGMASDQVLFDRSEFILPLEPAIAAQYLNLWQRVRTA